MIYSHSSAQSQGYGGHRQFKTTLQPNMLAARNIFLTSNGLPIARTIGFLGDSITEYFESNADNGTFLSNTNRGYVYWTQAALLGKSFAMFNVAGGTAPGTCSAGTYEFAYAGYTVDQISSNLVTQLNTNRPDLVCVLAGANDANSGSFTIFTRIQNLVSILRANGHNNILICAITPRTQAGVNNAEGVPLGLGLKGVNDLLAPWCASNGIKFCDWQAILGDANYTWLAGLADDGLHPNPRGAQIMGDFLANFITSNYRLSDFVYNAAYQATLNSTSGSAGINGLTYFGGSVTRSTITDADGLGDWIRINSNNTPPGQTELYGFLADIPAGMGFVSGDLIQHFMEIRFPSDLSNYSIQSYLQHAGVNSHNMGPISAISTIRAGRYFFYGQPIPFVSGNQYRVFSTITGLGSIDIRRYGIRKVTSKIPPFV